MSYAYSAEQIKQWVTSLYNVRERSLNQGLAKHEERSDGYSTSTSGVNV